VRGDGMWRTDGCRNIHILPKVLCIVGAGIVVATSCLTVLTHT
jgi:hypothetical protein